MNRKKIQAHELALGAMCIALSCVLALIRITPMPQGGAITPVSMLPIMIFCYICGVKGLPGLIELIACLIRGALQFTIEPFFANFVQFSLDYILAFAALFLAGIFRDAKCKKTNTIMFGIILAILVKYILHVVSGIAFYAEYAPPGQNVLIYSLIYNWYVLAEGLLCIIVMLIPQLNKFVLDRRILTRGE